MNKIRVAAAFVFCLASIFLYTTVATAEAQYKSFSISNHGKLQLQIPEEWSASTAGDPPLITIKSKTSAPFELLVTATGRPPFAAPLPDADQLRHEAEKAAELVAPRAVEKHLPLVELKGPLTYGFYFSATDSAPGPGEYKYFTQGFARTGDVMLLFTILTNEGQEKAVSEALSVVAGARHLPLVSKSSTGKTESAGNRFRIPLPTGRSVIVFPLGTMEVNNADPKIPYYFFSDKKTGLNVSFNFEPAVKCSTSRQCRDLFAARLKHRSPNRTGWEMSDVDGVHFNENIDMTEIKGVNFRQKHMNVHYVKDGVWIDMHLSKVLFEEKDKDLFIRFIKSVTFE